MNVQWTRKRSNKRMILKIKNGVVCLSTPYFISKKQALAFIEQSKPWIERELEKDRACILEEGNTISLLDQSYLLQEGKRCMIKENICYFTRNENQWRHFLKLLAEEYIRPRLFYWVNKMGHSPVTLVFGFYRSKWGSCQKERKEIRLNAYLVYADWQMIDSILIHELCHLKISNHSPVFYQEVYRWMPDYDEVHNRFKALKIYRTN